MQIHKNPFRVLGVMAAMLMSLLFGCGPTEVTRVDSPDGSPQGSEVSDSVVEQFESAGATYNVGDEFPELVGEDLFGESFALADYKGKVILLDFFGDW